MNPHTRNFAIFLIALCGAGIFQIGTWLGYATGWIVEQIRERWGPKQEYADAVEIVNHDMVQHILEGPVLKRLIIYASPIGERRTTIVKGPILCLEGNTLQKYAAFDIVEDMLTLYAIGRQLGVNMTPDQARRCVRDFFQIANRADEADFQYFRPLLEEVMRVWPAPEPQKSS